MVETTRRGRGGKLARSEVVQVRLDPKLRFATELAAAKERRTLSSFVEWAVERAVREVTVTETLESAAGVADRVWDVDEADRFVNLATRCPGLLTHDEQRRWKFIQETRAFWLRARDIFHLLPNRPAIRATWSLINEHLDRREPFDWKAFANQIEERGVAVQYEEPKIEEGYLPAYLRKEGDIDNPNLPFF